MQVASLYPSLIPKISIITPSLNQAQYIEQTIDSVLSQNYPNLEYIIIDGGSTDGSVDIIKKHQKHLAYWVSEPDRGQSHAINKGVQKATGDIINWLNSDDYYEANALQKVAKSFENPRVSCLCGRSRLFDETGTVRFSRGTDIYPGNIYKTIGWARIDQPETFFRRKAWESVGLLNDNLHYTMDREWWMRYLNIFGLKGIAKIDEPLVNFRLHDASKTISQSLKFDIEHNTLFYLMAKANGNRNISNLIKNNSQIDESITSEIEQWSNQELIQKALNYYLLKKADEFYYTDKTELAKSHLDKVKKQWLTVEDRRLYVSLKLKCKLPLSIIRRFRK